MLDPYGQFRVNLPTFMSRVLVTGIGVVSPLGRGARKTMEALLQGASAIGPLTLFDLPGTRSSLAAQTDVVAAEPGLSRADTMAILACREALGEARLDPREEAVSLFVGGTTAGMFECEADLARLTRTPHAAFDRSIVRCQPLDAPARRVHEAVGPFASTRTICSACSGGAIALMLAASAIRAGRIERAIAGGVDALSRLSYAGFSALGAIDTRACRPFDKERSGLTLGEASAFLVLESEASARARGVPVLCDLAGWASANEAHHITHPEPDGATAARVMSAALARAGLSARDVDYVNAHGTGTPPNDEMEARAIRAVLGEEADRIAVSSAKGAVGHTLAAAGAIEAAIAALSVVLGAKPPTVGLVDPDPRCNVRHLLRAEHGRVRATLSNAFGFGGTDVTLLFAETGFAKSSDTKTTRVLVTGAASTPARAPLDPMRARRLERASRLFTACAVDARGGIDASDAAVVAGSAWGSPAATGRILCELFEKGPRFVSPAVFPGALPSALASSASIYLGTHGVAFTTADGAASAESAILSAIELVERGEARAVLCGGVEEASEVAERVSSPVGSGLPDRGRRGEGAAAVLLESADDARGEPLAEVVFAGAWQRAMQEVPAPRTPHARVFLAREDLEVPASWRSAPALVIDDGEHEAVGAKAFVAAVHALTHGEEALVLGPRHAFVLGRGRT